MFVSPVSENITFSGRAEGVIKKAWENYTIYEDGVFYALFGTGIKGEANASGYAIALDAARSSDGVHWEFFCRDAMPIKGAHAGFGIKKIGDWFYYYPTCSNAEKGVHFKVFRTKDFVAFEHMGDEFDVVPDRRYYHERWDEVCIIKDREENGGEVYYGYISSETKDDVGEPGCGFMKSYDGISWTVLPPIEIVWGDIAPQHMELNFVEKIGDYYFLSMSGRLYMDSYGYSLYSFRGKSPRGPFWPDAEKYRLSGNSRRDITWLGHSIAYPGGFLAALWLSRDANPDIPSSSFAIGDLKKILYEDGHIRFGYWEGTEKAKGGEIKLKLDEIRMAHPAKEARSEKDNLEATPEEVKISASRDGVVALFRENFDSKKGFFIEGEFCASESRTHIATHHHAASFGFYFENGENNGAAIIADTLGVTRSGALRYSGCKITEKNPYRHAGAGLADGRSGALRGTLDFDHDDTAGPLGHASMCGIRHGKQHKFKLLSRCDYFVLYIDGYYVQTYLMPENFTGKVGICCFDGEAKITLKAWEMSF